MGLGVEAAFPLQGGARQSHLAWGCPWAHTGAPNKAPASQGALTRCGWPPGEPSVQVQTRAAGFPATPTPKLVGAGAESQGRPGAH